MQSQKIIKLSYQLAELPSAQHRAGLAGLVLMIKELKHQQLLNNYQEAHLELNHDEYSAILEFNLEGLKALFDLTYQSFKEERATETKIKDYERVEEVIDQDKKGVNKIKKLYYYSVIVPQGAFLSAWDESNENDMM